MKVRKCLKNLFVLCLTFILILDCLPCTVYAADTESVEKYAPEGTRNVAVGANVTISNASAEKNGENSYEMPNEGWCKSMLVDGKLTNGWSTDPYDRETDKDKPVTVTIDLKSKTEIEAIALFPNGTFPKTYKISVSEDGKSYREVAQSTNNTAKPTVPNVHSFTPCEARYVRIHVSERDSTSSGRDGLLVQLAEVAVYGKAKTSLEMKRSEIELLVGQTDTLTVDYVSASGNQTLTWSSSDSSVVKVDANGKVTALKTGNAIIKAESKEDKISCQTKVYVVKEKKKFDDNIMISVFWPPTVNYVNDEQYKLMADAGITYVMGSGEETLRTPEVQKKMLELCNKYGMLMTVGDGRLGGSLLNMSEKEINAVLDEYRNVPGVGGYYMLDEPFNPNTFINAYKILKSIEPDKYMHLNFLPSASYGSEHTYISQMNDWVKLCAATGYTQDYLMYDRYPFGAAAGSMDRNGFLANMASCHKVGIENNVKTGAYIQTVKLVNGFRRPTESEIRYEIYMYMAYGYKQISYFTWFTPVNRGAEVFDDGIISPDGKPNAHYETVSILNHEILNIGKTLINCEAVEIYLNGQTWGQEAIPKDFFIQPTDKTNYTVSLMKNVKTGENCFMLVNNDFGKAQTIKVKLDPSVKSVKKVIKTTGEYEDVKIENNTLEIKLAAGDGELFVLPKGVNFVKEKEELPAGKNLAERGQIQCDSSVGSDDKYMDNLNDGDRNAKDGGKGGWTVNGNKTSEIVVDLTLKSNFNRIDIYPAGLPAQYAKNLSGSVKVSVSDDMKNWKEVLNVEKLDLSDAKAPSLTFNKSEARYIKIEFSNYKNKSLSLAEIEVYLDDGSVPPPDASSANEEIIYNKGDNIALKRPAVASSTTSSEYKVWGWAEEFINDGNKDKGWTSNVKIHMTPDASEYIIIDFGDLFAVDTVKVTPMGLWPEDFEILLSTDGINWTSIAKVTGSTNRKDEYVLTLDNPVSGRYIKFISTKMRSSSADGYMLQLGEIEAYGTPVCDKSILKAAMDKYVVAGGDEKSEIYSKAKTAYENEYLTSSSMKLIVTSIESEIKKLENSETTEPSETETETANGTETESDKKETSVSTSEENTGKTTEHKRGCKSALTVVGIIPMLVALVCVANVKKKKNDD